ncbi:putative signal transducing protein [Mariniflexile ostreae]|uniref:Signal transducing protein n=1 Tax=Mariniflexile ostreae TaxID=1520892 RepID=A0ABV5FFH1_9FLAO
MKNSNYIRVFTGDFMAVQRVFLELESENICAVIKDESESGRLAGFASSIQGFQDILVHKDELDKALSIMETLASSLKTKSSESPF